MNSAAAGKRAERRVRDDLAEQGYTIVTSHLSRGPADLIAAKFGACMHLQVKRTPRSGGGVGPAEWNALYEHAAAFGATPVIAFAEPRRPVRYMRLTGRKDTPGRQPWVSLVLDEVAE